MISHGFIEISLSANGDEITFVVFVLDDHRLRILSKQSLLQIFDFYVTSHGQKSDFIAKEAFESHFSWWKIGVGDSPQGRQRCSARS
jgi:hypothetical protein